MIVVSCARYVHDIIGFMLYPEGEYNEAAEKS
jgi:hypothetical protein